MLFHDLSVQYQNNKADINKAIQTVLDSGMFINGPQVRELEECLREYVGTDCCISCGNGTDALILALMALEVSTQDAVFVPAFTFFSTAEAVSVLGAMPVFVDVDETLNMNPHSLMNAVKAVYDEKRWIPKAVIAVDLFGQPANFPEISEICRKEGLYLIEDAAQSFGGKIKDKRAGSFADIATTSFFPSKPLGCYGDGGAIFTDNHDWAKLFRSLKVHGKGENKYDNLHIGMNSRLDTIQAAVLLEKMKLFCSFELAQLQESADLYTELLSGYVETPVIKKNYSSAWAQYSILLKDFEEREALRRYLKSREIPSMVYYPRPLHMQPVYLGKIKEYVSLERTEDFSRRILSLPMHPYLSDEEINAVCSEIISFCENRKRIVGK